MRKHQLIMLAIFSLFLLSSFSQGTMKPYSTQGTTTTQAGYNNGYYSQGTNKALYIYGGKDHYVFLGCLNCDDISSNSIWNDIGSYGSDISATSIWNDIGEYGSDISNYSPFNDMATYPPVIVDRDGGFYGYFTTNESHAKRADFDLVNIIYKYHEFIQKDVSKWHDKIFR